jgi:phenylalanyl-tRNA synthetase beta chain
VDFYDATGAVEALCEALGVTPRIEPVTVPFLVPGQSATVLVNETPIGLVGLVSPAIVESRGAPRQDRVFVAELNLDRLAADITTVRVRALPKHPFVVRDLSIVVPASLPAEIIRGTIQTAGGTTPAPLVGVNIFDRYQGKGIGEGSVSLSMRMTFQAPDRTLTDGDVQASIETILATLVREHRAVQR